MRSLINVKFNKLNPSDSIVNYINNKLGRHRLEENNISRVECHANKYSSKGNEKYGMVLSVHGGNTSFSMKENGNDIYRVIDILSGKLNRKLSREHERRTEQ
jgi:ribosomal subunit interface protein